MPEQLDGPPHVGLGATLIEVELVTHSIRQLVDAAAVQPHPHDRRGSLQNMDSCGVPTRVDDDDVVVHGRPVDSRMSSEWSHDARMVRCGIVRTLAAVTC